MSATSAVNLAVNPSEVISKGPLVWMDMDQAALDAAYDQSVWAPNQSAIHARRAVLGLAAYERLKPRRVAYGNTPIEGFDFYPCGRAGAPMMVWVHGGAWRGGRSHDFAHLAEPFLMAGVHVAVLDFINIDDAGGDLMTMASQVRSAFAYIWRHAAGMGADQSRIFAGGHSSGGHLGGCVFSADWARDFALPAKILRGTILLSGMYDLAPVRLSARSKYVNFTDEMVDELSAMRHLDRINCPVILAHGTLESPEFQRQTRDFFSALQKAGKPAELIVAEGTNHFEILESLHNPFGLVGRAALRLVET